MNTYSVTDFTATLAEAKTEAAIWQATTRFFSHYGLDGVVYLDADGDDFTLRSTLPESWHQHYVDSRYHEIDPFAEICCGQYRAAVTGADNLHHYPQMRQRPRKLVLEAGETGYRAGFSSPFRLVSPRGFGGWNLMSAEGVKASQATAKTHGDVLHMAAFCAHQALSKARLPDDTLLSPREVECLQWLANGLRTQKIAHNMGLKPVTVEFHFRRAREKLGANTREQALAMAIMGGLIVL